MNFGQPGGDHAIGDIDCNGDAAFPDFLILAENFGKTARAAASVPEPDFPCLGIAILLIGGLRCRRR